MIEFLQVAWVQRTVLVVGGVLVGVLLERVVVERAHRMARRTHFKWDDLVVESVRTVPTVWLTCTGIYLALGVGTLDPQLVSTVVSVLTVVLIGSIAIAGMRATGGAVEMLSGRADGAIGSPTVVVNMARLAVGVLGVFIILQNSASTSPRSSRRWALVVSRSRSRCRTRSGTSSRAFRSFSRSRSVRRTTCGSTREKRVGSLT